MAQTSALESLIRKTTSIDLSDVDKLDVDENLAEAINYFIVEKGRTIKEILEAALIDAKVEEYYKKDIKLKRPKREKKNKNDLADETNKSVSDSAKEMSELEWFLLKKGRGIKKNIANKKEKKCNQK